jgi:hypothetical protein
VIAPSGDIGQAPPSPGANSYFEDGSVAAVKKWRFCLGLRVEKLTSYLYISSLSLDGMVGRRLK